MKLTLIIQRCAMLTVLAMPACSTGPDEDPLGSRLGVWIPDLSTMPEWNIFDFRGERIQHVFFNERGWAAGVHVVSTPSQWRATWNIATPEVLPGVPAPEFDFTTSVILTAVGTFEGFVVLDSIVSFELGDRAHITSIFDKPPIAFNGPTPVRFYPSPKFNIVDWKNREIF